MAGNGRPRIGGGKFAIASLSSTAIDVKSARGFYISTDVDAWVTVRDNNTVINPMDGTNSTFIRGGQNYGPLDIMGGVDKFIHVAGAGVAGNVWVTIL